MTDSRFRVPYTAWDFIAAAFIAGATACLFAWAVEEREAHLIALLGVSAVLMAAGSLFEHHTLPPVQPTREERTNAVLAAIAVVAVSVVVFVGVDDRYIDGAAIFAILAAPAGAAAATSGPRPDRDGMGEAAKRFFTWVPV